MSTFHGRVVREESLTFHSPVHVRCLQEEKTVAMETLKREKDLAADMLSADSDKFQKECLAYEQVLHELRKG